MTQPDEVVYDLIHASVEIQFQPADTVVRNVPHRGDNDAYVAVEQLFQIVFAHEGGDDGNEHAVHPARDKVVDVPFEVRRAPADVDEIIFAHRRLLDALYDLHLQRAGYVVGEHRDGVRAVGDHRPRNHVGAVIEFVRCRHHPLAKGGRNVAFVGKHVRNRRFGNARKRRHLRPLRADASPRPPLDFHFHFALLASVFRLPCAVHSCMTRRICDVRYKPLER